MNEAKKKSKNSIFISANMSNTKDEGKNVERAIKKEKEFFYQNNLKYKETFGQHNNEKINGKIILGIGICVFIFIFISSHITNQKNIEAKKKEILKTAESRKENRNNVNEEKSNSEEESSIIVENISESKDIILTEHEQVVYEYTKNYFSGNMTKEEFYFDLPESRNKVRWLPGKKMVLEMIEEKNSDFAETSKPRETDMKSFLPGEQYNAAVEAIDLLIERKSKVDNNRINEIDKKLEELAEKIAKGGW